MNRNLPTAVVVNINHFVATRLAIKLLEKEMNVIGIGEWMPEGEWGHNFEFLQQGGNVEEDVNYIFCFGELNDTTFSNAENAKKCRVIVNKTEDESLLKTDWRLVEGYGVYGPGVEDEGGDKELALLMENLSLAVNNKNLSLPKPDTKIRLLAVDDLVEAILRTSFLSGFDGEKVELWGRTITAREIAEVLIDKAKMTRFKVAELSWNENEIDESLVESSWRKIRYSPQVEFGEGVEELLRELFAKTDEEKRKRGGKNNNTKKTMEVIVESEESIDADEPIKKEEKLIIIKPEIVEEKEPEEVFKIANLSSKVVEEDDGIVIKNSNLRFGKNETKEDRNIVLTDDPSSGDDTSTSTVDKPLQTENRVNEKKTGRKLLIKKRWLGAGMVLGLLLIAIIIPGRWLWVGYNAWATIEKTTSMLSKGEWEKADLLLDRAIGRVEAIDEEISDGGWNRIGWWRNYQAVLRVAEDGLRTEKKAIELALIGARIGEAVLNEKEVDWDKDLKRSDELLGELIADIGNIQGRLSGNWNWVPDRWKSWPQRKMKDLGDIKDLLIKSKEVLAGIPEIIGLDGKKREYMVLFQNENELRAGGGFIGSYGIVTFEDGRLLGLEVKDVYEADGQLKGHVDPPEPIYAYLGEGGWFMRDANWQADFRKSAKDIAWFLEKETGRTTNGIIGINLSVAKAMLGVVGEVYVPDFKEKINKDNLYEQAEFYSETKFFPGSNQKASFLGGLSKQLFEEIKNMNLEEKGKMIEAMIEMLDENEIQLAMVDKKLALMTGKLGWDGAMYQASCSGNRCFADYLYVVESNLGVNKANYFLYRNIEQLVEISPGAIARVLKISYENTAKNSNWPAGDYKNYIRLYIPQTSNIAGITVLDPTGRNESKIYSQSDLRIDSVMGKKEVGLLMTVPVNQKRVLEVRYTDTISLLGGENFSYLHYIQKQSGFGDTGMVVLLSFPEGWQPMQAEPVASLVGGKLLFNQKLDRDLKVGVEISN